MEQDGKTVKQSDQRHSHLPIYIPLLVILLLTAVTLTGKLDFFISDLFYNRVSGKWEYSRTILERLIYFLAPVPAFVVFVGGVLVALAGIWRKKWRCWRRCAIYFSLVMLLGPGLIVNVGFKEWYGRPRPKQVTAYGGSMEFHSVWASGEPHKGKSFPSGHAAIGFYFMAGYFAWWRENRSRARRWLFTGLAGGLLIGFSRMADGAHWFSDVAWSGVFIYCISYLIAWACGLMKQNIRQTADH